MANNVSHTHEQEDRMEHIVHITRPELTAEEREKRLEAIKQAAVRLVLATERQKGTSRK